MASAVVAEWPEPYLQPDRNKDCGFYSAAYVARCLGRPDVTAEMVKAWRAETRYHEAAYAREGLGAEHLRFTLAEDEGDQEGRNAFWLGPRRREWAQRHLDAGWIAQVMLHRIAGMGHAAVVLGYSGVGVQLMDPIYGHVTEPWGWFLGPGPKAECAVWPGTAQDGRPFYGCHFIEGWYRLPEGVAA